jgi:hypothetical protein
MSRYGDYEGMPEQILATTEIAPALPSAAEIRERVLEAAQSAAHPAADDHQCLEVITAKVMGIVLDLMTAIGVRDMQAEEARREQALRLLGRVDRAEMAREAIRDELECVRAERDEAQRALACSRLERLGVAG